MGAAKRDLKMILDYLSRGYVAVDSVGINWARVDLLKEDGYDVVQIYPPSLESSKKAKSKTNKDLKKAHHPITQEEK